MYEKKNCSDVYDRVAPVLPVYNIILYPVCMRFSWFKHLVIISRRIPVFFFVYYVSLFGLRTNQLIYCCYFVYCFFSRHPVGMLHVRRLN